MYMKSCTKFFEMLSLIRYEASLGYLKKSSEILKRCAIILTHCINKVRINVRHVMNHV